jgi:hypothetical protein
MSVLGVGGPAMMGLNNHPTEQRWMSPLVELCHWSCEVLLCIGNRVGLLLVITLIPTS